MLGCMRRIGGNVRRGNRKTAPLGGAVFLVT